jgi:DNA helicase-4
MKQLNENHRQYKPDFYLPEINLYLEHYAVDQHGKPPAHFGQKYLDDMKWKSGIHQQYKTDLITTTFHEFITGSIFRSWNRSLNQGDKYLSHVALLRLTLKHSHL